MRLLPVLCVATLAGTPHMVIGQEPRLALQLRTDQDSVHAGDEILITFVVTNIGTTTYRYTDRNYDRSGRMGEYQLRAYGANGTPVPDPRTLSRLHQGYIGGGIGAFAELPAGGTLSKTIALNLWAFVVAPGDYTVVGVYIAENRQSVESPPLIVRVLPRGDAEMGRHIDQLRRQLKDADAPDVRARLVRRLMYTADARAALPLLEVSPHEDNTAFWIGEAFSYYLPKNAAILAQAITATRESGLSQSSVRVLEQLEASRETITQMIGEALVHTDPAVRSEAALAAQRYPDDRFMPVLIEFATAGSGTARVRAIYALAGNRTDAVVATLKALRESPEAEIRRIANQAIESAYRRPAAARGRPFRPDDFPDIANRRF